MGLKVEIAPVYLHHLPEGTVFQTQTHREAMFLKLKSATENQSKVPCVDMTDFRLVDFNQNSIVSASWTDNMTLVIGAKKPDPASS